MKEQIKPGFFGETVSADNRRIEFDLRNNQFLYMEQKADIVFLGDSITQIWDLELYFNRNVLKINRGIGGDNTRYAAKRFEADVLQLEIPRIVIFLGINDILAIHPNLWHNIPGRDPEEVLSEIEENFRDMLSKCGGKQVYICSILPQSLCEPYDRKLFEKTILRANGILKKLCDEFGAEYVDYYGAIEKDYDGLPPEISYDGVHPNGKGYEIMARVLKEKIGIL